MNILTWQWAIYVLSLVAGEIIGIAPRYEEIQHNNTFLWLMIGPSAVVTLVPLLCRWIMKTNGGTPPLRFGKDALEVPLSANTRKTIKIPYEEALSAVVYGKGKRALRFRYTEARLRIPS